MEGTGGQQWTKVPHLWLACRRGPQLHLPGLASTTSSLLQQLAASCPAHAPAAQPSSSKHHVQDNQKLRCSHSRDASFIHWTSFTQL